jgi:uncharacterized membrane protein YccC
VKWRGVSREVVEDVAEIGDMIGQTLTAFWRELGELGQDPARTRQGLVAACSVVLATSLALWFELEAPWWAAISGYMCLMTNGAGSVKRGILRMTGTVGGALVGFVLARWLLYDHFLLCLFLAAVTLLGVVAMQVSPHGVAWLFLTVTSCLVLLSSLDAPQQTYTVAGYRVIEVGVGVISAIIVANVLQDWHVEPPAIVPGWRHLLGEQWPVVLHGARSAIAVVAVLWVWIMIELPEVTQMALTVAIVMSVPAAVGGLNSRHGVAIRSVHRFIGCLLGGVAALGCLALNVTAFPWWLAMIGAGVWIGMHIQVGRHGVGYAGTQWVTVFIVTLIQGSSPPASIMPGIDRFVGIMGGLAILFVVSLVLWPTDAEQTETR